MVNAYDGPRAISRPERHHNGMADFIYTMRKVRKAHGDKVILDDVTLNFLPGAKIGVVGPNGAGKSSVLRIMAGLDQPNNGDAFIQPGATVGILQQEPQLDEDKTVRENVEAGVAIKGKLNRYNEVAELMATDYTDELMEEMGQLQEELDAADAWDIDSQLEQAMDALRCPPPDEPVSHLSGGERRRVALCRLLLSKPDLLLLDEPTNHLDAESVQWLEEVLQRFPGTVVAVTHDRYFLDNAAGWILELDRGHGIPWEGNYSSWLEQKEKRLQVEASQEAARIKAMQHELEWVRQNPKGRASKSKARLARFEELSSQEHQERNETQEIFIPVAERLGNEVIEFKDVSKGYGERLLMENVSFQVPPGAIVGIIGPNGAGKSTLFKLINKKEKPDSGKIVIGKTVKIAHADQSRDELQDDKTVFEAISGGNDTIQVGKVQMPSRSYLARFNFRGADQQKQVGQLSGGERGRLHLAMMLKSGSNVLLLDEPSNDLDVETLRALEEALLEFAGSVLVISHDRWFLDRIATHILSFEGNSQAVFFAGNYQEYEADKRKRLGEEAAKPHRIKYKALK